MRAGPRFVATTEATRDTLRLRGHNSCRGHLSRWVRGPKRTACFAVWDGVAYPPRRPRVVHVAHPDRGDLAGHRGGLAQRPAHRPLQRPAASLREPRACTPDRDLQVREGAGASIRPRGQLDVQGRVPDRVAELAQGAEEHPQRRAASMSGGQLRRSALDRRRIDEPDTVVRSDLLRSGDPLVMQPPSEPLNHLPATVQSRRGEIAAFGPTDSHRARQQLDITKPAACVRGFARSARRLGTVRAVGALRVLGHGGASTNDARNARIRCHRRNAAGTRSSRSWNASAITSVTRACRPVDGTPHLTS